MADPLRVLLTGPPGCGKTTVILRTRDLLSQPAAGFYTAELRSGEGGGRLGFDVVALNGRRGPLARVGRPGPQVGKYAVDLSSFEDVGVRAVEVALPEPHTLLVIDELGKMELLSAAFVALLERAFRSPHPLLGTILRDPHPLADRFRHAPGVELIQVARQNRDALPAELARRFSTIHCAGRGAPGSPSRLEAP